MNLQLHFIRKVFFLLTIFFVFITCTDNEAVLPNYIAQGKYEGDYNPKDAWRSCSPEQVGVCSEDLKKVHNYVANDSINTNGLLIIKNGYIIYEEYFNSHNRHTLHTSYSLAKGFTSAAVGHAIDKELIGSVDDKIMNYLSQLQAEYVQPEKKEVTIKHLLTMSAGFEWSEGDYYSGNSADDIFEMMETSNDYIDYVLSKPIIHSPGQIVYYSSGESMVLSGIVENATGKSLFNYMDENIFQKIGIRSIIWDQDPSGHTIGGWGINATLRDYARFGYLYLNSGSWGNEQILSEEWIGNSVDPQISGISNYGYQWWIGEGIRSFNENNIPVDTYLGIGIYRQYLVIIPSKNLIIVRTGYDNVTNTQNWGIAPLTRLVLDAIE